MSDKVRGELSLCCYVECETAAAFQLVVNDMDRPWIGFVTYSVCEKDLAMLVKELLDKYAFHTITIGQWRVV